MITLTVAILAVWRASLLVTEDEGPFSAFSWLREHIDPYQTTWVGRGINCVWCVSWWAGLVMAIWLWYYAALPMFMIPVWWFGVSGGAIALQTVYDRLSRRR